MNYFHLCPHLADSKHSFALPCFAWNLSHLLSKAMSELPYEPGDLNATFIGRIDEDHYCQVMKIQHLS